jgi:hypothetical protein
MSDEIGLADWAVDSLRSAREAIEQAHNSLTARQGFRSVLLGRQGALAQAAGRLAAARDIYQGAYDLVRRDKPVDLDGVRAAGASVVAAAGPYLAADIVRVLRDELDLAGRHLADYAEMFRPAPGPSRPRPAPSVRSVGSASLTFEDGPAAPAGPAGDALSPGSLAALAAGEPEPFDARVRRWREAAAAEIAPRRPGDGPAPAPTAAARTGATVRKAPLGR